MTKTTFILCDAACDVLTEPDPWKKASKTQNYVQKWFNTHNATIGKTVLPDRPSRPSKPELRRANEMPKRRKAGSVSGKIALLHALAHIELNAIDLAWDIMARFSHFSDEHVKDSNFSLPHAFFDDWCHVATDEAKHFLMLSKRMNDFNADYGDHPAHDGLWEASLKTSHDFAARLAIVPMVLEARGLDVTPNMIKSMTNQKDMITADILQTIHDDEITHVAAGTRWFYHWCDFHNKRVKETWQELVQLYFNGPLKKPFNDPSRIKAGMIPDWYAPLSEI